MSEHGNEVKLDGNDVCSVKDGRFVLPCKGLSEIVQGQAAFSKAKGIREWQYFKRGVGASRSFIGARSDSHPDGLLFNFCPICGTDISAPFAPAEESIP